MHVLVVENDALSAYRELDYRADRQDGGAGDFLAKPGSTGAA